MTDSGKGWYGDRIRHMLAAKGLTTVKKTSKADSKGPRQPTVDLLDNLGKFSETQRAEIDRRASSDRLKAELEKKERDIKRLRVRKNG